MTTIENSLNHLNSLSKDDWNKLFYLIPKIEESENFGKMSGGEEISPGTVQMLYWDWAGITRSFVKTVYELDLVLNFDWMDWSEGKTLLKNKSQEFEKLDIVTLCKLLTTIIRADRFNDGYLISNFNNGTILKIIKVIRNIQMQKDTRGQLKNDQ